MSLKKWINIQKWFLLVTSHFLKIEIWDLFVKSSSRELMFCSLWELWAWDHHEVGLVGSSLGRPWIVVIFSYFYTIFILLWGSSFLAFWLWDRDPPFIWFFSISASIFGSYLFGGWELVFPSISVCWFYLVGQVGTLYLFSSWGFGVLWFIIFGKFGF